MARPPGGEGDGNDLAALTGDGHGPVTSGKADLVDVGADGLKDPQPVEGQQRHQGVALS